MTHDVVAANDAPPDMALLAAPHDGESSVDTTGDSLLGVSVRPGATSTSASNASIAALVVATERLFRLGLARLLSEDERIVVVEVSDGATELPELCRANAVDVVLVDLELTRADAIESVRRLASQCPDVKTLVLTSNADWRVRPAMLAGATGVLLKDASPEAIRAAVVSIHLGYQVFCKEAARWVLGEQPTHLTQRESDVLRMVAHGASNAEIAAQLHLGQKTVRNYVSRLYRKLELRNRAQVATYVSQAEAPHLASGPATRRPENEGRHPQ